MTANGWQVAHFGDLLQTVSRPVKVEPGETYRVLGMRWYAQGLFLKEEKLGQEIRAKEVYRVEEGDFVYNRLFAWKGSFGIVGRDTAGGVVSGEFPYFYVDPARASAKFLHLYLSQERIWDEIARNSSGQTNVSRLRLKEGNFLRMEIPLPPLAEQQRIVARIEALARRVEEARGLRRAAVEEGEAVMGATLSEIFDESRPIAAPMPIAEMGLCLNSVTRNPAKQFPSKEFLYVDISAVEGGTGKISSPQKILGANAPSRARRGIREGDVIVSTVRPNLKSFALVPPELDNQVCSTGFAVFSCPDGVVPKFLLYQFFSPYFLAQAEALVTGGHYPALNDKAINSIHLMIPNETTQRRIVAYLDGLQAKVDELRRLQAQTQKELDAMMPSILAKAFAGEL